VCPLSNSPHILTHDPTHLTHYRFNLDIKFPINSLRCPSPVPRPASRLLLLYCVRYLKAFSDIRTFPGLPLHQAANRNHGQPAALVSLVTARPTSRPTTPQLPTSLGRHQLRVSDLYFTFSTSSVYPVDRPLLCYIVTHTHYTHTHTNTPHQTQPNPPTIKPHQHSRDIS
jgi:hypothetical protein